MTRFQFRLEPLLNLRRSEEERARRSFLARLREVRLKEEEARVLEREREEAKERLAARQEGALDPEEVLFARRYLNILFGRIARKREEVQGRLPALEEARAAHGAASRRRRAVEKLRERHWREHRREEARRESWELDEVAQDRFQRVRESQEEALER